MAQAERAAGSEAKLVLLSVTLPRAVSLAGAPSAHFTAGKYTIAVDERGDVRITDKRGNVLFVPKQQAILEYAPRGG